MTNMHPNARRNLTAGYLVLAYWITIAFALNALFSARELSAQETKSREGAIKAAALYYVAKFVRWPTISNEQGTFNICIAGEDPLNDEIEKAVSGKLIDSQKLAVIFLKDGESKKVTTSCQILFLGNLPESHKKTLLEGLDGKPILTVTTATDIAWNIADIFFVEQDNRLRIGIDRERTTAKQLKVSSELLQLAIVKPE